MLLAAEACKPLRRVQRLALRGAVRASPRRCAARARPTLATTGFWAPTAATTWVAACACALLAATAAPRPVDAAPRCSALMLSCTFGGVARPVSLRQVAADTSLRRKVQKAIAAKDCYLVPTSEEPFGCDWRGTLSSGNLHVAAPAPAPAPESAATGDSGRTGTTVRASRGAEGPGEAESTARANETTSPAPRRDSGGRFGTTPAPQQPHAAISTPDRGPFAEHIEAAAARYQLPADLLRAVMQVESGYNPDAQSVKGAIGLMQLLPETGRAMGADDLRDPAQNIPAGARFLRLLANRFGGDLVKVLSAYHAGGTRVLRRDATPFAATDSYVRKVLGIYYALRDG